MKQALDLAVIWMYCLVAAVFIPVDIPFVAASLAAVVYGCGSSLARAGNVRLGMTLLFLFFSVVCPQILIYVPLGVYTLLDVSGAAAERGLRQRLDADVVEAGGTDADGMAVDLTCRLSGRYDILDVRGYVAGVAACCFGAALYISPDRALVCFAAVGCVIAGMIQYQTGRYRLLDERYRRTRDDSEEKNLL